jgi:hypothetical protein
MKLQERIEVAEDANEFIDEDRTVGVRSEYPMERQALKTYTLPIYHHFQLELRKNTSYNARDYGYVVFEIFPIQGSMFWYGNKSYMVYVDFENEIYNCECFIFNRDGILCCHVLKVISYLGAMKKYHTTTFYLGGAKILQIL